MEGGARGVRLDPDIHSFFLGDDCVLLCERTQRIHLLNTSAAVIWCHAADGPRVETITQRVAETLGIGAAEAGGFVAAAVADWSARGLLADAAMRAPDEAAAAPPIPAPRSAGACGYVTVAAHSYRLLGTTFRLRFTAAEQASAVHPVLAHLESGEARWDIVADVVATGGRLVLRSEGLEHGACGGIAELAPLVKGFVWASAVNRHEFFLGIHAAVVCGPSGALLLPGDPGSGKSTLAAALMAAGFQYFSDEMALLTEDLRVLPVPFALCVKEPGRAVLGARFPALHMLPVHLRADGKRVVYLPPTGTAAPAQAPVRAIVFPRYVADAPTDCRPIAKAAALARLMTHCLVIRQRLTPGRVRAMIGWIETVPCFEAVVGSLDKAVAALASLVR
jgi:hypothetical protein